MFKRIFFTLFFTGMFAIGVLCLYRAWLPVSKMIVFTVTVLNKRIGYTSGKSGRSYYLAFKVVDRNTEIAINLGTEAEASRDTIYNLINAGQPYTFYLDPTVPVSGGVCRGIKKIDQGGKELFKDSGTINLVFGCVFIVMSLGAIVLFNRPKKPAAASANAAAATPSPAD